MNSQSALRPNISEAGMLDSTPRVAATAVTPEYQVDWSVVSNTSPPLPLHTQVTWKWATHQKIG